MGFAAGIALTAFARCSALKGLPLCVLPSSSHGFGEGGSGSSGGGGGGGSDSSDSRLSHKVDAVHKRLTNDLPIFELVLYEIVRQVCVVFLPCRTVSS